MQKGATMVFAWKADGPLQVEFHGEPDQKPQSNYFESYLLDNQTGKDRFHGSFTAPTTGVHGWYWKNETKKDVQMQPIGLRVLRLLQDVRRGHTA
jgi:hypothetical protein